jgi:murein L,D-transpeptidase YafK
MKSNIYIICSYYLRKLAITSFGISILFNYVHAQSTIPSSSRSREAINRVSLRLTTELSENGLEFGSPIFIRIFKESRELELWIEREDTFHLFKNYHICT